MKTAEKAGKVLARLESRQIITDRHLCAVLIVIYFMGKLPMRKRQRTSKRTHRKRTILLGERSIDRKLIKRGIKCRVQDEGKTKRNLRSDPRQPCAR